MKNHNRLTICTAQFHGWCLCFAELIMVNENTLSKEFLPFSFPSQCEKCRRRATTSTVNHFGSNFLDVPKICYRLLQVVKAKRSDCSVKSLLFDRTRVRRGGEGTMTQSFQSTDPL